MVWRLLIGFLIVFSIYRVGVWSIRMIGRMPPDALPPGEMRRIKVRYRCDICGAEARMTLARTETPEPPRHCMEDMELIPVDDLL